jgi:predicted nucleotidyltransferase
MGSQAYGVSTEDSDYDVYGFVVPPKDYIFPHLRGEIVGFGDKGPGFDTWQQHRIGDKETRKIWDFQIYSIVRYFHLLMENNPNIIDSMFVPSHCILHSTEVANMIRDNRKMFLHKGCWPRFKGYAFSQMHKIKVKDPIGNRKEGKDKYGYDLKYAYHLVRLLDEVRQILEEGDLDLDRNKEKLKAIRRGEWKIEEIESYFQTREKNLEQLYDKSSLPSVPPKDRIKDLLLSCLEHHYGNLGTAIVIEGKVENALRQIYEIAEKHLR